jgi:hypothetical protein
LQQRKASWIHNKIQTNRANTTPLDSKAGKIAKERNVNAASAKNKVANRGAVASMAAANRAVAAKRVAVSKPDDKAW